MKSTVAFFMICIAASLLSACASPSEDKWTETVRQRKKAQAAFRKQAEELVAQMTLEEKLSLYSMKSPAIEWLGIGPHDWWNEALHGVARNGLATQFPQSISMASTWDPQLIQKMSTAIGREARAKHHQEPGRNSRYQGLTIWSPTINLARDPRWGRNEETYGEDPLLTSAMAVSFVKGLQGNHPKYLQAVSTVKHFIANNTEHNRYSYRPNISERDLREHYMPAYKAAVQQADVQSVMSAYNGINDVPCSANKWLLTDLLRNEWGFSGTVVTDVGVPARLISEHHYVENNSEALAAMVTAGVDIASSLKSTLPDAEAVLADGLMTMDEFDRAIVQNLTTRMQLGQIADDPDNPYKSIPASVIGSDEHLKIAREIAQKGAVLLKNDPVNGRPVLPLKSGQIKQVIVAGPYANAAFLGHYSGTPTHKTVTPFEGLRAAAPDLNIRMHRFAGDQAQAIPSSVLLPPPGEEAQGGLKGEYIRGNDLTAAPEAVRIDPNIDFTWKRPISNVDPLIPGEKFSIRWTGRLAPDISGTYRLAIKPKSSMRVWLDGKKVIDTWETGEKEKEPVKSGELPLEAGKTYALKVEYFTPGKYTSEATLGWTLPKGYDADFFQAGIAPDSDSTLVVYVGGFSPATAGEFADYPDLSMPEDQLNDLQRWVKRYKNIALVLNGGTIITEPWLFENLPSVLETWYAGQEGGHALADLILGKVSPSGRLPLTWYGSDQDIPELDDYAIHTGRTYMYNKQPAQFPFGHGLSYTTFEYGTPRLSKEVISQNDTLTVKVPVRNTGSMAAEEVVQLYVRDLESVVYQPKKKLAAFGRVSVKPGETSVLKLEIPAERLAWWDAENERFTVEPGEFELQIGASSEDIRQRARFTVAP